jgi:ornithine cyclodeaminase/alanine dehydrogenase-like protein (mu-crystallin family)
MDEGPRYVGGAELRSAVPHRDAVEALETAFRDADHALQPQRMNLAVPTGELLQMPAFGAEGVGVKLVTVNPDNPARDLPFIQGLYVLFHADTLRPLVVIDGAALTALRTAAMSALATRHLARADARRLVVFGAGAQAEAHVEAVAAVRPIDHVTVVGRSRERAEALLRRIRSSGLHAELAGPAAVGDADVVCTCTTSAAPLFAAGQLASGAHVNAVGSYRRDRRELDPGVLRRALVIVESVEAALEEAGDLVQAIEERRFAAADIAGELSDVVRGDLGRSTPAQVTIFKSVGLAMEDLAIAGAAAHRLGLDEPVTAR